MTIESFLKLQPPVFIGNLLAKDPQDFIDQTVKAIKVLMCPNERVVDLAAYQLGDRAEQWYQTFLIGRPPDLPPLAWEEFSEAFMIRFLPASGRVSLAVEFEKLTRVLGMTSSEHEDRFSQLLRHALYMVPTDALRTERFIRGLANPMLTTLSSHVGKTTYAEAVDVALRIEVGQQERRASQEAAEKSKSRGSFLGGPSASGSFDPHNHP